MTASSSRSKSASTMSVVSLAAPLGALGVMLTPWGWSTLKALLLEPIRINPPAWLRVLLTAVVVANIRSTPFAWHMRVLYPAFKALLIAQPWWPFPSRSSPAPQTTHKPSQPLLQLHRLPLGRDIFEDASSHHFVATLDECDWNGHLSNSSYSKSLDYTRMAHNSPRFLKMYYDGGWVALGGSGFNFHREIPLLAKYAIRMSIEAWDDKWLYVVGRFVPRAAEGEETAYCTSISRYVCKANRRTIPPWLVIATSGYGTQPTTKSNWEKAEQLRNYYLDKHRKAYLESTGKKTIPAKVEAKLVQKAALLRQFRTVGEREGTEEEAWMSKSYWHIDEWETRRKEGLERLAANVGILPPLEK